MGARVYIPAIGRFLQVDPEQGGTPNAYVYPPDPVNDFDLTGSFGLKSFASIASYGSMIPGPIGMASAAVSAAAYAKAGDRKQAALMVATIAAAAVGAGMAVKAVQASKGVSVGTKIASSVWAKGSASSRTANLVAHYANHGVSMGYRSPLTYTGGALKNILLSKSTAILKSGSRAFVRKDRITLTYRGAISSFYKSKNAMKWLNNARR